MNKTRKIESLHLIRSQDALEGTYTLDTLSKIAQFSSSIRTVIFVSVC